MYYLKGTFFYCLLLFFISCKGKKDSSQANVSTLSVKDSTKNGSNDRAGTEMEEMLFNFDKYEEKGRLDLKNYFISIQAGYYSSDSLTYFNSLYPQRNILIVRTKAK